MSQKVFAVTGATGNIGSQLVELLLAGGHRVRALARASARLDALGARGAEAHAGSIDDASLLSAAFRGADGVFAMLPPDYAAASMRDRQREVAEAVVSAVAGAGVRKVVVLSSVGAHLAEGTGPIAGLHDFEARFAALGGVDVLALRAAFFMENFLHDIGLIRGAGIHGGAGAPEAKIAMVATRDIAQTAARRLVAGDFRAGAVQYVLGPRDVAFAEATRILGAAIGRPDLPYVQFGYDDTRKALLGAGFSESAADAFVEMYRGFNDGRIVPTEPRSSANTTPTSLEAWAPSFAAAFAASA